MKNIFISALVSLMLVGCAQNYQPIVDLRGSNVNQYQADLYECQQYAAQSSPVQDALVGGAIGGGGGAALGAITGALLGGVGAGPAAALGGALGGAVGLGAGAYHGVAEQKTIVNRCLAGRGYNILNAGY